jgi:chromosome segregation ATPase
MQENLQSLKVQAGADAGALLISSAEAALLRTHLDKNEQLAAITVECTNARHWEQQAQAAELEICKLTEELSGASHQASQLQNDLALKQTEVELLQSNCKKIEEQGRARQQGLQQQIATLTAQLENAERYPKMLEELRTELSMKNTEMEKITSSFRDREADMCKAMEDLKADVETMQMQLKDPDTNLQALQSELTRTQHKVLETNQTRAELEKQLEEQKQSAYRETEALQQELEDLRVSSRTRDESLEAALSREESLKTQIRQVETQLGENTAQLTLASAQQSTSENIIAGLHEQLQELQYRSENALQQAKLREKELEERSASLCSKETALQESIEVLITRVTELQKEKETSTQSMESLITNQNLLVEKCQYAVDQAKAAKAAQEQTQAEHAKVVAEFEEQLKKQQEHYLLLQEESAKKGEIHQIRASDIAELKRQLQEARQAHSNVPSQFSGPSELQADMERQLKSSQDTINELEKRLQERTQQLEHLKFSQTSLEEEVSRVKHNADELATSNVQLERRLAQLLHEGKEAHNLTPKWTNPLLPDSDDAAAEKEGPAAARIADLEQQLLLLHEEHQSAQDDVAVTASKAAEFQAMLESAATEMESLRKQKDDMEHEKQLLHGYIDALRNDVTRADMELAAQLTRSVYMEDELIAKRKQLQDFVDRRTPCLDEELTRLIRKRFAVSKQTHEEKFREIAAHVVTACER